ncbi:hypothetical protein [Metaclostridioides mangenotii]|uniref:hypothetical protein n=1 Tax=Metaclostridioides mangenotii TaxID=1540 RepID=UPI0004657AA1|nr:hypothetical protein [Clostridioides mangenotii]
MLKGLAYDLAKEEFYLEPSLKIFEDFHKYLSENGYHISAVDHFDIHASKNNINVIFSYDASVDDYFYLLRTIDSNKKVFQIQLYALDMKITYIGYIQNMRKVQLKRKIFLILKKS